MKTGIVAAIIAVIALAFFNPGMDDFRTFVRAQAEGMIQRETGESELGGLLSDVGGSLAGRYIDRITERRNYFVFSTYTVDFDGDDSEAEDWRFLGIAGQFVELDRPESIEAERPEESGAR